MVTTTTGIATEFIQFTRASNATVTDSDGKIKWAPHNLLTNSESFDNTNWAKSNATVTANAAAAPNGTTTADLIQFSATGGRIGQVVALTSGQTFTFGIAIRVASGTRNYQITDNAATPAVLGTITATTSWQFLSVSFAGTGEGAIRLVDNNASGFVDTYIWGAHLYRSDLGGMQANTSAYPMYNPTTPKNLLGFSEDFSNAAWVKGNSSIVSNTVIAPNGLATADKLVDNTTNGSHLVYNNTAITVTASPCTVSVYAKAAELSWVYVRCDNGGAGEGVWFNLATGTKGTEDSGRVGSIVSVGNGWYRCSVTATLSAGSAYASIVLATSNGTKTYTGDGTSGIYIWGAQFSDSASLDSYVPVYGAAVTSAAYYGPRRDFDSAGVCKGLLVEEQRTNLILRSAEFDNAYWAKSNTSVTANAVNGPDGVSSADLIVPNTTAVQHSINHAGSATTIVSGTTYTVSFYIKAGGYTSATFSHTNIAIGFPVVDLTNGTVSGGSGTNTITPVGNGWYRVTSTGAASSTSGYFILYPKDTSSFAGDGTSGVYLFGVQLEAGSFATSYIPTGAATATRSADVASVSTQAFPYSSTEGTIVVNVSTFDTSSNLPTHINLSDGTTSNYIRMNSQPTTYKLRNYTRAGGADVVNATTGGATVANEAFKAGVYYKANSFNSSVNGSISTEVTTGAVPAAATTLSIGNWFTSAGTFLNGHIRQITYLPRRISNTELQTRTA